MSDEISVVVADSFDVALAGAPSIVSHTHPASQISDSTQAGRELLTAANTLQQQLYLGIDPTARDFPNVAALLADTSLVYGGTSATSVTSGQVIRTRKEGYSYIVADSAAADNDVVTARGVKLYIADTLASPGHLGADPTGGADAAPYVEAILAKRMTCDLGGSENTWLLASRIGIPQQSLYANESYRVIGQGCLVVVGGVDRLFTSAGWKADPSSTANLYVGKIEFTGINFRQSADSTIFDGDHLYNCYIHHCSFDGIDTIIYSGANKGGSYTDGYLQSLSFEHNNVSDTAFVCNAKRAFNCRFSNNFFEACVKGIYIDGAGQPAVSGLNVISNSFEGSTGLFLKLGDYYGLTVSGNYMEANSGGDVDTYKCYMYVSGAASQLLAGSFNNNHAGLTAGQIADTSFELIKFASTTTVLRYTSFHNNWTNGKLVTSNRAIMAYGNRYAGTQNTPRLANENRVEFLATRIAATYAANASGGSLTIAKFTLPTWSALGQTARTMTLKLNCFVQHLTAGVIVTGSDLFEINILVMGTEGTTGDVKIVSASLVNWLPAPSGVSFIPSSPTALTVQMFTAPALTLNESGGVYSLDLSGFAAQTTPVVGATTNFVNNLTATIYNYNRSDAAIARTGDIVFTA